MTIAAPTYPWRPSGGNAVELLGCISLVLLLFACAGWTPSAGAQAAAPTREEIRAAQQQLLEQGFNPGVIDGAYGSKTIRAIKQFQRSLDLTVTGKFDAPTLAALSHQATPDEETVERLRGLEQQVEELGAGLKTLGEALELNSLAIVDNTERLDAGIKRIDQITLPLGSTVEQTQQHAVTLDKHEKHLKDNSVKLYETLLNVEEAQQSIEATRKLVHDTQPEEHEQDASNSTYAGADSQLLLSLPLCLLVPLGVLLHHGGFLGAAASANNRTTSSSVHPGPTAWVVAAWVGAGLGFYLLGFGIMFGTSLSSWVGTPLHFFADLLQKAPAGIKPELLTVLMPQVLLAGIAGVIVCSAVPDRLPPLGHLITALLVGGIIYPLFGHWASAEQLLSDNEGWLSAVGFMSSGGASGVALLAGVAGLSLANGLRRSGAAAQQEQHASELTRWATPGLLLLWVAWYGVILATSIGELPIAPLLLATYLTSVGAGVAALVINRLFSTDPRWEQRLAGAALVGTIAASGAHTTASATELMLLGLLAGGLHTFALHLLRPRLGRSSELAGSVAVGGLLGTLGPTLFGPDGFLFVPSVDRILPQLLGIGAALVLAGVAGKLLAWPARRWAKGPYAEVAA